MKILHTADWHLGHAFHDRSREGEQRVLLEWLLELLVREEVDALLICGDIFDTANPSAAAQALWYEFLARLHRARPELTVVAIAGNHDSAARLEAPEPLLRAMRIHVVGHVALAPRPGEPGEPELERLVLPLPTRDGRVGAWVVAMPFLRPIDLPPVEAEEGADPLVEGVRALYHQALELARARRQPGQALLVLGHCYLAGTQLSEVSERKILGGNLHALPPGLFPADVTYVALGHLHRPQRVGGQEQVRYPGAPLPLAMDEAVHPSQVLLLELIADQLGAVRSVATPRPVSFMRLPAEGPRPLAEVESLLRGTTFPPGEPPYLEVQVLLERPEPGLRPRIEAALAGQGVRLLRVTTRYQGTGPTLGLAAGPSLDQLREEEVFRRRYAQDFPGDPPPELLAAFHELRDLAGQQGG